MDERDTALLERIQHETESALHDAVGPGTRRAALLDFPAHKNVGDSLIWAGERAYLRRLGVKIAYTCDVGNYDAELLRSRHPDGPILLHGGGNWGDLYPVYQRFRERVLRDFPDRKIVQLPQSIWFESDTEAERANGVFGSHRDFTLLVREADSVERRERQLPDVRSAFCHDSAFGAGSMKRHRSAVPLVALLRRDAESVQSGLADVGGETVDWGLHGLPRLVTRALRIPARAVRRTPIRLRSLVQPVLTASLDAQAHVNVEAGARMLSRGEKVVTDRLHAHVLCALLGIRHVTLDNSYGKIHAVMDATSAGFSTVTSAGASRVDPRALERLLA